TAWEVSPAYQREGADYSRLFDTPFPPEEPLPTSDSAPSERPTPNTERRAPGVPWRLMPAGTNPEQPWLLDLLALLGGEQRVAYLRTAVWSGSARELV